MAIRLIRENSDTPNITNKDDARMIRYAYGGQNGYVKGSRLRMRQKSTLPFIARSILRSAAVRR